MAEMKNLRQLNEEQRTVTCRSEKCKARIKFILRRSNDKRIPVDANRVTWGVDVPPGIDRILLDTGEVAIGPPDGTEGYVPHHITCKDVNHFRQRKGGASHA